MHKRIPCTPVGMHTHTQTLPKLRVLWKTRQVAPWRGLCGERKGLKAQVLEFSPLSGEELATRSSAEVPVGVWWGVRLPWAPFCLLVAILGLAAVCGVCGGGAERADLAGLEGLHLWIYVALFFFLSSLSFFLSTMFKALRLYGRCVCMAAKMVEFLVLLVCNLNILFFNPS